MTITSQLSHRIIPHIIQIKVNKLTEVNFAARLAQANLASKNDLANFVKKTDFDKKLKNLSKKIISIKQSMYLLKTN